jgi:hypothetical protein
MILPSAPNQLLVAGVALLLFVVCSVILRWNDVTGGSALLGSSFLLSENQKVKRCILFVIENNSFHSFFLHAKGQN